MGELGTQLLVAILVLAVGGIFGILGFFFARAINQNDRTTTKQTRSEVELARLRERLDAYERTNPLLLRDNDVAEQGQRALAYDQSKLKDEFSKLRTDMAASEADLTGKLNSAMAEFRATFASINDRLAARDARHAESETAQREIISKLNDLSVAVARLEARLELPQPSAAQSYSEPLSPRDRRVLDLLATLAAKASDA